MTIASQTHIISMTVPVTTSNTNNTPNSICSLKKSSNHISLRQQQTYVCMHHRRKIEHVHPILTNQVFTCAKRLTIVLFRKQFLLRLFLYTFLHLVMHPTILRLVITDRTCFARERSGVSAIHFCDIWAHFWGFLP